MKTLQESNVVVVFAKLLHSAENTVRKISALEREERLRERNGKKHSAFVR
jgi:hypothetical protein